MALINEKTRILFNLFLPQQKKPNPKHAIPESDKNLSGKTIVFTGGTDGIGRVAVEMLYMMGANVVFLERIKESASSRIVILTTNTVFIDHIDFEDIQSKPDFDTSQTYMEAKLSMNMFSIDLAQKLEGTGVTVNYLCPGYIKSNFLSNLKGAMKIMQFFMNTMASPTEVGADRIVRLAISSEFNNRTGTYVNEDKIEVPHPESQIAAKRKQLRKISEKVLSKWLLGH